MPEVEQLLYTYQELTELMLRDRGITSGHWAVFVKFRFTGGNIDVEGATHPAAITLIEGIGLQRTDASFPLAVDATKVNNSGRVRRRAAQKSG
jgi:hypothetical protein